ncbi:MAG TPA: hypothetical protein VF883_22270 [Thermoanaerobaculia bacterium]|jgi:antitoxin component of MazEF toxin-antitoxin module
MKKKLSRVGDDAVLVPDEPLLQRLGLGKDGEVELSMSDEGLLVTPIHDQDDERRFREAAEKVMAKHAGLFRRLSK